jgi:hypothetical protein
MIEPLRPLSIGELLDRTFSLYRQNFKLFIGVSVLGPAALLCSQMALAAVGVGSATHSAGVIQNQVSIIATVSAGMIFYLLGHSISMAASVRAVAAVYLGKAIQIGEAYASVKGHVLRVLGVVLSVMLIAGLGSGLIIGLGALIMFIAISGGRGIAGQTGSVVGGIFGTVALIALILVAIGFAVRYAFSVQACVVEDLTVGASLKRSAVLAKNARKRVVTVFAVCMVIIYVVAFLFAALSQFVPAGTSMFARQLLTQITGLISGVLGAPLMTIAMSLVYYDERVRKEAFDLQLLMESLDEAKPADTSSVASSLG